MSDISAMLDQLYRLPNAPDSQLEKTAEEQLAEGLRAEASTTVGEDPYKDMSTDDLIALAKKLESEVAPIVEKDVADDAIKVAHETLGGQVMAHAMINEFELIKEAMVGGKCRVCKENPRDVEGSSICSACLKDDDE